MNVAPITNPLPGEHLSTTAPTITPETAIDWHQRLNFWAGRALTADALELEQDHCAALLARLGRIGTPGVVTGLDVALEPPATPQTELALAGHFLHLLPGTGFTVYGEDATIPRPLRIPLEQIPVHYLRTSGDGEPAPGDAAASTPLELGGFQLQVDDFATGYIPWAAVLVARPAEIRTFSNLDPTDPCELDPSLDAFADERRLDATILRLFQLPLAWQNDPLLAEPDDPRWRNRLAELIFRAETEGSARHYLRYLASQAAQDRWDVVAAEQTIFPWELFGLPLALLGSEIVSGESRSFFLDRASIARPGGLARARSRVAIRLATAENDESLLPPGAGTPSLWRARVDQFAENLSRFSDLPAAGQAANFQFVPPVGLLPRNALDFLTTDEAVVLPPSTPGAAPDRAAVSDFFPATFDVEAVPVPTEDLDFLLAASAPLAPFDFTAAGDVVRVLVPVAQNLFDPQLLVVEQEDPFFATEVARLIAVRQDWRQRRDFVRTARDLWQVLISGPLPAGGTAALDPGQLEPEPVEGEDLLGGTAAFLSPTGTIGPWELTANFAGSELTPTTQLYLRLRLDGDAPPSKLEVRWRQGDAEFLHVWTAPSDAPVEQNDASGAPLPERLARLYTVTASDLGVTSGALTGFTLHLDDGRVGVIEAGQVVPSGGQIPTYQPWWSANAEAAVSFLGGDWTLVSGTSQMSAPFEQDYQPVFSDMALVDRVAEIDANLHLPDGGHVLDVGLEKIIAQVSGDLAKANDSVDLGFLKAQSNIQRIRQVLLGEDVANNLLTSPALGSVVKAQSAQVAQADLISVLKAATTTTTSAAAPPSAPAPGPAAVSRAPLVTGFTVNSSLLKAAATVSPAIGIGTRATIPVPKIPGIVIAASPSETATTSSPRSNAFLAAAIQNQTIPTRGDVVNAEPVVGKSFDLRTITIAKRFDAGQTRSAFDFADAGLIEALGHVTAADLGYDDTDMIPDVTDANDGSVSFAQLYRGGTALLQQLHTTQLPETDDSVILSNGVRRADATVLVWRRFEFYIARRQAQLDRAREVLAAARASVAAAQGRINVLESPLAEARQDVSVARALRQEEEDRVAGINTQRDDLLRDEVKFLAYVRPRAVDPVRRLVPGWKLDSTDALAPVPACLRQHDQPPDALRAYVQLFRQASVSWFPGLAPRLRELDTRSKLTELLAATQQSSLVFAAQQRVAFAQNVTHVATQNTLLSAFSIVEPLRTKAATLQINTASTVSWSDLQRQAQENSSLGDIIDGRHGNPTLARAAANLLGQIQDVATCLHAEFAAVAAATRLLWVERYSQFDRPLPLRDLTVLPNYGSLDRSARRRFQAFVDWLFQKVDNSVPDAFNLINDLVRICLLLASNAPVNSLIAGHLPRPVPVRPGVLIPLRPFDPKQVRVGMEVHVWNGNTLVAQGQVEDLGETEVSARVNRLLTAATSLDQTMRVQFVPAAFGISQAITAR